MVERIGDVQIASRIQSHIRGLRKPARGKRAAVAAESGAQRLNSRVRADVAARDLADDIVARIGYVDIAAAVHGDTDRARNVRAGCGLAVAIVSSSAVACDGRDVAAARSYRSDPLIKLIDDEERAVVIQREARRPGELRRGRRSRIAGKAASAGGPRIGGDRVTDLALA